MFEINTERLRLIPLNAEDYRLYIDNSNKLEKKLGLKVTNNVVEGPVKGAHESRLKKVIENNEEYMWETNWKVILREENRSIAGVMIKGAPNDRGEVIIGYGTNEAYQNKGYMTEAISGLIKWIFDNPKALSIIADTDKDNVPSHRVLEKNGFLKYNETVVTYNNGEVEELIWWKLDR